MSLPVWPGYGFDRNLGNDSRPRVQILDRRRDIPYTYNDDKLVKKDVSQFKSITNNCRSNKGPSWLVNSQKVLCFHGYWLEDVNNSARESYRSRNCHVMFYLEDDTIQVLEPRMRNSALAQGTVVKRHKILKPPPNDKLFYSVDDLNIGEILYLCGRCIKLTSCDLFTQNYLRRLGVKIPNIIEQPLDPLQTSKDNMIATQRKGKGNYRPSDNLTQFLDHSKNILRFYCFWDNLDLHNDPRSMTLHYFLEDDTIEIIENLHRNCGREGKLFLRRQKLPKTFINCDLNFPGYLSDPSYLNVIRTSKFDHKVLDSLSMDDKSFPCYKDCDLSLGQYINVLGRKFMLCDCDEFTKEFYRKKYGISNFKSIDINQYWKQGEKVSKFIAPHNGWGSEEDSMLNCLSITPTEVVKSCKQFMSMKTAIDDLMVLHFMAIILRAETNFDKDRRFILAYRMEDDNFFINEQTSEKIGHNFTLFLNRDKYMKPKRLRKDIDVPEYYQACDFYIGALIEVKGLVLKIILADEYTLKYMEKHFHKFANSSLERILNKLRKNLIHSKADVEYFFKNEDPLDTGFINYTVLKQFKENFANDFLVEQEVVTIARLYKKWEITLPNADRMVAEIRQILRKHNYSNFYMIKEHWYNMSPNKTSLHISNARSILKGLKFPLSDDQLCDLLKLSKTGTDDEIDLCSLLEIIEWQNFQPDYFNKVGKFLQCPVDTNMIENLKLAQIFPEKTFNIGMISWKDLLNDIFNPSNSSKAHPTTQRMMQSGHCKETYE